MNIAEKSLHLLIARMAWACEIKKRPGIEIPWYDYTSGFNVQPKPFLFDLDPRNQEKGKLVESTWLQGGNSTPLF